MWKCQPKSTEKGWGAYEVLSNDGDGVKTTEGWCGYGTTYKAIHKRCPNVRKREACPQCRSLEKAVSTGRVKAACPDCDGKGAVRSVYFIVTDTSQIPGCRAQTGESTTSKMGEIVVRRKLTKEELDAFMTEHPSGKSFERLEDLLRFFKTYSPTDDAPADEVAKNTDPAPVPAAPEKSSAGPQPAAPAAPVQYSEAIRKLIAIEEAHEREMRKRKFGDLPK